MCVCVCVTAMISPPGLFPPPLRLHTHLFSDYDTNTHTRIRRHTLECTHACASIFGTILTVYACRPPLSPSLSHLHLYQLSECMLVSIGCRNRRVLNRECRIEIQPSVPSLRGSESCPRWTRSGLVGTEEYHGHWIRTNMQLYRRPLWFFSASDTATTNSFANDFVPTHSTSIRFMCDLFTCQRVKTHMFHLQWNSVITNSVVIEHSIDYNE